MYDLLVKRFKREKNVKSKCYYAILLIQLRNGLRISEAVRAFKYFTTHNASECYVSVSKRKDTERLVVRPQELDLNNCSELVEVDDDKLITRLKVFSISKLKVNTHSLRYAFITHLLRNNVSPSIIAKITRHSKLDYILTYTQEKIGEEVLRNV